MTSCASIWWGCPATKFLAQLSQFGSHQESLLRYVVLSTIDERWKDHLYDLDHLKASIGFRGWGQKDPLIEYKQEAFDMFVDLLTDIQTSIARLIFRARLEQAPPPPPQVYGDVLHQGPGSQPQDASTGPAQRPAAPPPGSIGLGVNPGAAVRAPQPQQMTTNREEARPQQPVSVGDKVGRNDPCPCGSGKKYKACHGKV